MAKEKRKRADQEPSKEDPNQKRMRRSAKEKSVNFSYSDDKKLEEEEDWDRDEPDLDENEETDSSDGTSDRDSRSDDGSDHDEHSDREEDEVDPTRKGPTLKGADNPNEGSTNINTVEDLEAQIAALKAKVKMMNPVQNMKVDDNHETDKTKFPSTSVRKLNSESENIHIKYQTKLDGLVLRRCQKQH